MRRFICLISFIILTGCSLNPKDLVGTYEANYGESTEQLTLKADGHYWQVIWKRKGSQAKQENSGIWRIMPVKDFPDRLTIIFYDFLSADHRKNDSKEQNFTRTNFITACTKLFNSIECSIDEDTGLYYVKQ